MGFEQRGFAYGNKRGFASIPPVAEPTRHQHYITGDDSQIECWAPTYWLAQSFTPEISHKITSVKLLLYRSGNGAKLPGIVTVSIRAASGIHRPTGGDLCVGTTDGNTLPTAFPYEWREITLGDGINLIVPNEYATVVRALDSSVESTCAWRLDLDDGEYERGEEAYSVDSGVNWSAFAYCDHLFEEWGIDL